MAKFLIFISALLSSTGVHANICFSEAAVAAQETVLSNMKSMGFPVTVIPKMVNNLNAVTIGVGKGKLVIKTYLVSGDLHIDRGSPRPFAVRVELNSANCTVITSTQTAP